jgi:hypothetical protein
MVLDHVIDMADDSGHLWLKAWRCVSCGDVLDPQIMKRRALKAAGPAPVRQLVQPEPSPVQEVAEKKPRKSIEKIPA